MSLSCKKMISVLSCVLFFCISMSLTPASAQDILADVDVGAAAAQLEKLKRSGRSALKQGDVAAAIKFYEDVLLLDPKSGEALYQLAVINFRKGNHVRGFDLIQRAVAVTPAQNPLPRLALAKALTEIGKGEEAVQEYERALAGAGPSFRYAKQTSLEMDLLRLRLALENRDRDRILEIGRALMIDHEGNRTMLEVVATTYARSGLFDEARLAYERLLQQTPNNPAVAFYLAGVYEALRQPKKAIKYYEQAIANAD